MPFEELESITRDNMPPVATITYDVSTKKGARPNPDKKPRLTIAIPTTICGNAKSKTFRLLIGSGEHEGKLLVRGEPKPNGGVKPSEHAHFFRFNFGYVPRLGDEETFQGEKRPVTRVSDEEFMIDVPKSWFARVK